MTNTTRDAIKRIIDSGETSSNEKVQLIVDVVDASMIKAIEETFQFGELLEAVGLEIRSKDVI